MAQKRKRVILSMETKLAILKKIDQEVPLTRLADQYGVGRSTITDLKKNESKSVILFQLWTTRILAQVER